ncbi:stabilizer of axonemal microtubules 3 isoform X2 [Chelonoidis abingdonii]|uniref:stabilizer of axonemal microtubules 3 isoform X2 n=1 Tax=Chelonoidis abingdonii TaxID=106734 RepID=UPI003F4923E1
MAGTILPTPAGTDLGWGLEGARWRHSQDWLLTSSGVGLENWPPQPFPPPAARSTVHKPLPPGAEWPPREELIRRLATTTGLCYDVKTHGGVLGQPSYLLPAPLWRVHCNKDLRDKLQLRAWRVPLTPGGRPSETRHRFCGWPNLPPEPTHHAGPQPFALAAHHSDGASKSTVASTENKPLAGSVFYIRDRAVLSHLDPYVSVTSRDIRAFSPSCRATPGKTSSPTGSLRVTQRPGGTASGTPPWARMQHPPSDPPAPPATLVSSPAPPTPSACQRWPLLSHTRGR